MEHGGIVSWRSADRTSRPHGIRVDIGRPLLGSALGCPGAHSGQFGDHQLDPESKAYSQHYFDSRGVVRVYVMTLTDRIWTLLREKPDFSPLDFSQRFTGTFSDDAKTILGRWERSTDGSTWDQDFDLTYRKVK